MYKIYNEITKQSFEIHCGNSANARDICKVLNAFKAEGIWDYCVTEYWKSTKLRYKK